MASRKTVRTRIRIVAVLASLISIWAFAVAVTAREGVQMTRFAALENQIGQPIEALIAAAQSERRESVTAVTGGPVHPKALLLADRSVTDAAITRTLSGQHALAARWSIRHTTRSQLDDLHADLATLAATRAQIDTGRLNPLVTAAYFTGLIHQAMVVETGLGVWGGSGVTGTLSTLGDMAQSQEMMSREDALLAGAISSGQFTTVGRAALAQLVGAQRYLSTEVSTQLTGTDSTRYAALLASAPFTALRTMEDRMTQSGSSVVDGPSWQATVDVAIISIGRLSVSLTAATVDRVRSPLIWTAVRLVLTIGIGLFALTAAVRSARRTMRSLAAAPAGTGHGRLPLVARPNRVDVGAVVRPRRPGRPDVRPEGATRRNSRQRAGIKYTPSGLPWRDRRRKPLLPPRATAELGGRPQPAETAVPIARDPDEIRRIMSAYRDGADRGRSRRARTTSQPAAGPAATPENPDRLG